MRKSPQKLTLHRETIRHLGAGDLSGVAGGTFPTLICPTVNNTCDLTCDLCVTGNCQ